MIFTYHGVILQLVHKVRFCLASVFVKPQCPKKLVPAVQQNNIFEVCVVSNGVYLKEKMRFPGCLATIL